LTARHPVRTRRLDFKRFVFGRAVGRILINAGLGRMSALEANRNAASSIRMWYGVTLGLREPIRRREFITLIGAAAVAWPRAARGQEAQKPIRIGVLPFGSPSNAYDRLPFEA